MPCCFDGVSKSPCCTTEAGVAKRPPQQKTSRRRLTPGTRPPHNSVCHTPSCGSVSRSLRGPRGPSNPGGPNPRGPGPRPRGPVLSGPPARGPLSRGPSPCGPSPWRSMSRGGLGRSPRGPLARGPPCAQGGGPDIEPNRPPGRICWGPQPPPRPCCIQGGPPPARGPQPWPRIMGPRIPRCIPRPCIPRPRNACMSRHGPGPRNPGP